MSKKSKLKVIPLGGLDQIGKNITVFEYDDNIVILDCGLAFPDEEMFGVDLVIPDITYLQKNRDKIKAIVLTHGHEDHIGALPYVLKEINVPVYGTKLTLGLLENKLKEHGLLRKVKLNTVRQGSIIQIGTFKVEFIRTNHSIADAVAIAFHTPVGIIVHTGDFKVDYTPIEGEMIDLARLGTLGEKGVLALLADSTNVERPGYTMSEKTVGETFNKIFERSNKRILVATFASNIHRIQQIINAAVLYGRKVAVCGRSMLNVLSTSMELGYLNMPENTLIDVDQIDKYNDNQIVIITTGSQGEPMSALTRMAFSDHRKVDIVEGDLVIISAHPIPGNEKLVSRVINELFKKGADVIYETLADVHVSGHACQEELKLIHRLIKPKYFIPVHGEYRHLKQHARLAADLGLAKENIFVMDNGEVLELSENTAQITGSVEAGQVLVDGLGVGDVGNIVLRDRKHLAEDGLIVVIATLTGDKASVLMSIDVISRGFVYVREAEVLMDQVKNVAKNAVENCQEKSIRDWATIKSKIKNDLNIYLYGRTKRKPMILPVIIEV